MTHGKVLADRQRLSRIADQMGELRKLRNQLRASGLDDRSERIREIEQQIMILAASGTRGPAYVLGLRNSTRKRSPIVEAIGGAR